MSKRQLLCLSFALVLTAGSTGAFAAGVNLSILRQNYPAESLALGEQGAVEFAVDLDEDARVDSCIVTRSSGYRRLDAATCDLIVEHARFARARADGQFVATTRTGRVVWRLPEGHRQNAARAPAPVNISKAELEAQRLYCRRALAPGSRTRLQTYCLTRDDWELARSYARRQIEEWMPVPTSQ
jgi:TonB family protein